MLAVHEQVALMSFSQSEARLLLYVHEQFAMSLHLLCSNMYVCVYIYIYNIYIYICIMYTLRISSSSSFEVFNWQLLLKFPFHIYSPKFFVISFKVSIVRGFIVCHILLVSGNIDTAGGNEERLLERRSGYLLSFRLFELLLISLFCIFIIRCIKFNLIYINLLDLLV